MSNIQKQFFFPSCIPFRAYSELEKINFSFISKINCQLVIQTREEQEKILEKDWSSNVRINNLCEDFQCERNERRMDLLAHHQIQNHHLF